MALKFLPSELVRAPDAKRRFCQEARTASAIDHVNVCTIHDIEETTDGRVFLSMAYCDGETLKKRLEGGPLAGTEAVRIALQVARGLARAHQARIDRGRGDPIPGLAPGPNTTPPQTRSMDSKFRF